ncbi:MAG: hypothetical protein HOL01_19975 [Planctomycetaceae bacterium]|jgi:hypothetical protein|nr:hypothetical protein [Planctomycetaceae bacterium]MBT6486555.1 hypothetical protein [Planctomycetaceae bacterium]MBT6496816.1 hypothetical protein [Planctomycetaceae bacterium]
MSNESNKHELLSAYFDGELSPEDRQRAEQMLEESVDARRDIDGVAELSELVKSLPTEPAPVELLPAVMRQAERETLLPTDIAPPVASKVSSKSWMTVIGSIAAAAAAVLVAVQMLPTMTSGPTASSVVDASPGGTIVADNRTSQFGDDQFEIAESSPQPMAFDKSSPNEQVAFGRGDLPMAESPMAGAPAGARPEIARSFKRGAVPSAPAETRSAGRLAGGEPESLPGQPGKGGAPSIAAKEALSFNADLLQNARQGDVLQFFSTSETKVTTYMVTVVDVKQALNQMQVLLARNDIPAHMVENDVEPKESSAVEGKPTGGKKDNPADESGAKNNDAAKQPERLFAVYVETTPDRFTSALKDLLHDKIFAELHPKPPVDELQIEVADLGQSRRQLFSRLDATAKDEKKIGAVEQRFRNKVPALTEKNASRKDTPTGSPRSLRRKSKALGQSESASDSTKSKDKRDKQGERTDLIKRFADAGVDGVSSFQLRVQLAPLPKTAELQKLQAPESRAETTGKAGEIASSLPPESAFYAKPTKAEPGRVAPVRVLFVFREAATKPTP